MTDADKAKLSDLLELWHHEQLNRAQFVLFINLLLAERKDSKQQLADARAEVERLRDVLERLRSVQNGCPLPKYEAEWSKAMDDATAALSAKGASDDN